MLDEMSLISVVAAVALVCNFFSSINSGSPISTHFVILAFALQLFSFYVMVNDRRKTSSFQSRYLPALKWSWAAIVGIWLVWNFVLCIFLGTIWPRGVVYDIDWRFWILIAGACIFERLAEKQWKSIIKEQVVMVKEKHIDLRKALGAETKTKS
jgi:hypothetical protein